MKAFMDKDFLLNTDTAKKLYHETAEKLPIIDYHCHIDPAEIYNDKSWDNITQMWLGEAGSFKGDHYKWRLMRWAGIPEKYITGPACEEDFDKKRFTYWAKALGGAIGNPLYHWSHLELRNYFDYDGHLTGKNAGEVFDHCSKVIKEKKLSALSIIKNSNVRIICTTDDPADDLKYHKLLSGKQMECRVLPAFRPDRVWELKKADYPEYIKKLGESAGVSIDSLDTLKEALINRLDHFESLGCRTADHGMDYVSLCTCSDSEADGILKRRLLGDIPNEREYRMLFTALMLFLGEQYSKRGWVMQLHYGVKRNNNDRYFKMIGADSGHDCIGLRAPIDQLADFLNALDKDEHLPKTVIYSLDPGDNAAIGTIIGCFQEGTDGGPAKLQHGSAWWFNDHIRGMSKQMESLAALGRLSSFIGMLTDSRSFLSYARHEYFRRILCRILGNWVEEGMYPADFEALTGMVEDISLNNTMKYFGF